MPHVFFYQKEDLFSLFSQVQTWLFKILDLFLEVCSVFALALRGSTEAEGRWRGEAR